MARIRKTSPRNEYLQEENRRVVASPRLVEKFPGLKSMTVDLGYFDSEHLGRISQVRYAVNLEHAKAVFRIGCLNLDCVHGKFLRQKGCASRPGR